MSSKRRRLGQHFLDDGATLRRMVELAGISADDKVLEIGAGEGALTRELCKTGAKIVSFEIDSQLFSGLRESLHGVSNLKLLNADALKSNSKFDILVANLPYSRSEEFIEWLAMKRFRRAVTTLQTDFVDKLLSNSGRNYRAISVIAQHIFSMRKAAEVPKRLFRPPPRVASCIVVIRRIGTHPTKKDFQLVKYLWSFRGKTVSSAIKMISKKKGLPAEKIMASLGRVVSELRISKLPPSEAFRVAKAIEQAS